MKPDKELKELFDENADCFFYEESSSSELVLTRETFLRLAKQLIAEVEQPVRNQEIPEDKLREEILAYEKHCNAPFNLTEEEMLDLVNGFLNERKEQK